MVDLPRPQKDDSEDVLLALSTARALAKQGDMAEVSRWLRRAAKAAGEEGRDERALELARIAADLAPNVTSVPPPPTDVSGSGSVQVPPPVSGPPTVFESPEAKARERSVPPEARPEAEVAASALAALVQAASQPPPPTTPASEPASLEALAAQTTSPPTTTEPAGADAPAGAEEPQPWETGGDIAGASGGLPAASTAEPYAEAAGASGALDRRALSAPIGSPIPSSRVPSTPSSPVPSPVTPGPTAPHAGEFREVPASPADIFDEHPRPYHAYRVSVTPHGDGSFMCRIIGERETLTGHEAFLVPCDPSLDLLEDKR